MAFISGETPSGVGRSSFAPAFSSRLRAFHATGAGGIEQRSEAAVGAVLRARLAGHLVAPVVHCRAEIHFGALLDQEIRHCGGARRVGCLLPTSAPTGRGISRVCRPSRQPSPALRPWAASPVRAASISGVWSSSLPRFASAPAFSSCSISSLSLVAMASAKHGCAEHSCGRRAWRHASAAPSPSRRSSGTTAHISGVVPSGCGEHSHRRRRGWRPVRPCVRHRGSGAARSTA